MTNDESVLSKKYKAKKVPYFTRTVSLNELEYYLSEGWEEVTPLKYKVKIQKMKPAGVRFEDDIWCMFYNLGFRNLNYDEKLEIPYGNNPEDKHQLDVVAVGDEAIFVVECKATETIKAASFKKDIADMCLYKEGVTRALRQIYGADKKVKFIVAPCRGWPGGRP